MTSRIVYTANRGHNFDAGFGFYRPDAICQQVVPSLFGFIKLHQVYKHQTCCNLIFADLLQVDETTYIKPAYSSQLAASPLTTCNRLVIMQTGSSDENPS